MTHQADCSPETLSSLFRMLDQADEQIEQAKERRDTIIRMMREQAGKTFMHDGQIYQIFERARSDRGGKKVPSFKKLKDWPKTWLGGKKSFTQTRAASEESVQVDVLEGTRGELPSSDPMPLNPVGDGASGEGATPAAVIIS